LNLASRLAAQAICCLGFMVVADASIINFSFEQPVTSTYLGNPIDPTGGWTFSGRSGVAATVFFVGPPPDGNQVGYLQQYLDQPTALSSISQSLTGVALTPTTLSFYLAQRPGFAANPTVVTYGTQNLGTFSPAGTAFSLFSINFTPTAAAGTLTFKSAATTGTDLDTAIDLVTLTSSSVPEPTTVALIVPALAGMLLLRRRRVRG
jgi:hypothetical protein